MVTEEFIKKKIAEAEEAKTAALANANFAAGMIAAFQQIQMELLSQNGED